MSLVWLLPTLVLWFYLIILCGEAWDDRERRTISCLVLADTTLFGFIVGSWVAAVSGWVR